MERKRTTSEDAIQKTIHLLETINLKIESKDFPFSVYKLAQSHAIGNNTVRAIFKLGIIANIGNSHSGSYSWIQPVDDKRQTAIKVMNQALMFRNTTETKQSSLNGLAGEGIDASSLSVDELKRKLFKSPKNALKQQTLFSSSDEKLNHAVKIAAALASRAYTMTDLATVELLNLDHVNDNIILVTKNLLNKLYNIKF